MVDKIILLSGPIGAGKSVLTELLVDKYGAKVVKTRDIIQHLKPETPATREGFQAGGEQLDKETRGRWICDYVVKHFNDVEILIVDAARIKEQIDHIRTAYGTKVFHVHLTASQEELKKRFSEREQKFKEAASYAVAHRDATESAVESLGNCADIVVRTDRCDRNDILTRACAHLNLYARSTVPIVDVIIGGQYGSEAKGHIAQYISREYDYLVRVGGPNAGHKVYQGKEAAPVTFRHLPSGTLSASSARLILGPGAVINEEVLLKEISDHKIDVERLSIDPNALIILPEDIEYEKKHLSSISSTAQGVGHATARRILGRQDGSKVLFAKDIKSLRGYVRPTFDVLETAYNRGSKILLEGTQGTALSIYHGSYPHVTSRDTTVSGCLSEAGISPKRVRKVVMVCRTYPIRVADPTGGEGTSGYMKGKLDFDEIAKRSGLDAAQLKEAEKTSVSKKLRRVAEFDWELLRHSCVLNAPTDIALSFADYISAKNLDARRFEQLTPETIKFIEEVQTVSRSPVSLISTRFHYRSIIDRRNW